MHVLFTTSCIHKIVTLSPSHENFNRLLNREYDYIKLNDSCYSSLAIFASKSDETVLPTAVVASIAVLVIALGVILTCLMLYLRRKYKIHR